MKYDGKKKLIADYWILDLRVNVNREQKKGLERLIIGVMCMSVKTREFLLSGISEQKNIVRELLEDLSRQEVPEEVVNDIRLAIVEGINNAFLHGNKNTQGKVAVAWALNNKSLRFEIADQGPGFTYQPDQLEKRREEDLLMEGGMGIFLIQQVMDEIFYNEKGNVLSGLKSW